MSKHSPGPWKWERGELTRDADPDVEDVGYDLVDANGDDILPANIDDELTPSEADRSLIAAAPEMLQCVRYLASFDRFDNWTPPSDLVELAKELLKRIDGHGHE